MKQNKVEDNCRSIMEILLKQGYSYQVPQSEVETAMILAGVGHDERTWTRWIRVLEVYEYIKPLNKSLPNPIYEMNITKIPRLFELLKNIPQTHLATPSLSQKTDTTTTTKQDSTTTTK